MSSTTTKKAIAFAFKELLHEKSLQKITVNDIIERCDVNRQTFYYHFQDIPDLIEWICVEDAVKALAGKENYSSWQEGFLSIFELMRKDKVFVTNIYNSISHESLTKYLYRLVFPVIYKVVEEKSSGFPMRDDDKVFITDFYKYSFVAIVLKWIHDGMNEDPVKIVRRVAGVVEGTLDHAIESMRKN